MKSLLKKPARRPPPAGTSKATAAASRSGSPRPSSARLKQPPPSNDARRPPPPRNVSAEDVQLLEVRAHLEHAQNLSPYASTIVIALPAAALPTAAKLIIRML